MGCTLRFLKNLYWLAKDTHGSKLSNCSNVFFIFFIAILCVKMPCVTRALHILQGKLLILRTFDGGATWSELPEEQRPQVLEGQGGFAASGTCLVTQVKKTIYAYFCVKAFKVLSCLIPANGVDIWVKNKIKIT